MVHDGSELAAGVTGDGSARTLNVTHTVRSGLVTSGIEGLGAEEQALVAAVQGKVLDVADLDWQRLRRLALAHGIAPLVQEAWQHDPTIPSSFLVEFARLRKEGGLAVAVGLCQRDAAVHLLDAANIPSVVLKGAGLAGHWYGDLSLRPFVDIDLLVPEALRLPARDLLLRSGYRALTEGGPAHHDSALYCPGLPCPIELHHRLSPLPLRSSLPFEHLAARALVLNRGGIPVRVLGPEDTLLHLCLHLLQHLLATPGWRLRHVCDIARHVSVFPLQWDVVMERGKVLGIEHACRAVLGLVALLTGVAVPPDVMDAAGGSMLFPEMATFSVPEAGKHTRLYQVVAALRRGDVVKAVSIPLRQPGDIPEALLDVMAGLVRDHRRLRREMGRGMALQFAWVRSQQLVSGLLAEG